MPSIPSKGHWRTVYTQIPTQHGIWSGTTPFALNTGISIKYGNNKNYPTPFVLEMDRSKALWQKSQFEINRLRVDIVNSIDFYFLDRNLRRKDVTYHGLRQAKRWPLTCAKSTNSDSNNAYAKSHPGICISLIRSIVSNDSVSGQRMPWAACAEAQADLGLRCPLMPEDTFLHDAAHKKYANMKWKHNRTFFLCIL